ncbi:DUF1189 family protein [uncultured Legionella sp.]|uniref:DUF1189 family protein n=1 Tax=uncultured Legionella sp. TaxID=210934 RepID=UPI002621A1DD|nr:DUF1189 family protein [uncultured Legionella sp.]
MKKNKSTIKPVDAPSYGYWSALYMSFYSKRLYIDVGKRWKGIGLLYLLLVVAVLAIPYSVNMSKEFDKDFQELFLVPIKQLPTIYIQNGEVTFDKPMPYFIKNDKGQIVTIIDTTGTVNEFTKEYPKLTLLINKEQMAFKLPAPSMMNLVDEDTRGPSVIQPFDKGMNMMFDGNSIVNNSSIYGLKYAAQVIMYPIVVAIFYSLFAVFFLVLAFLGQVFSTIFFSFKLGFKKSCRLFMVSSTPMLAILMLFLTLNLIFPGFGFILLIVLAGYYSFAIYSLRSESLQVVSQ